MWDRKCERERQQGHVQEWQLGCEPVFFLVPQDMAIVGFDEKIDPARMIERIEVVKRNFVCDRCLPISVTQLNARYELGRRDASLCFVEPERLEEDGEVALQDSASVLRSMVPFFMWMVDTFPYRRINARWVRSHLNRDNTIEPPRQYGILGNFILRSQRWFLQRPMSTVAERQEHIASCIIGTVYKAMKKFFWEEDSTKWGLRSCHFCGLYNVENWAGNAHFYKMETRFYVQRCPLDEEEGFVDKPFYEYGLCCQWCLRKAVARWCLPEVEGQRDTSSHSRFLAHFHIRADRDEVPLFIKLAMFNIGALGLLQKYQSCFVVHPDSFGPILDEAETVLPLNEEQLQSIAVTQLGNEFKRRRIGMA
eukprot:TRINITY_DN978_c0_g1_i10.p1 TRINITY_DN978_c0_g1~~TRINITY_DN978_c0_g1_i10.p1  ORF type:complete len:365 (-),score=68.04 TRINITY_DN978_c0_g1_i10:81-1175(-)